MRLIVEAFVLDLLLDPDKIPPVLRVVLESDVEFELL